MQQGQQRPQQKDQLYLNGERSSGQDVRTQNVTAASSVANVVKTSLGPIGLDKMLVDDLGEVTITNDGATILDQLEVEHPAARVLVQLSEMQDKEVGDGTTSVVIVAAELLKRANELVKNSIHPTTIMSGYRLAMKESIKFIKDQLAVKTATLGREIGFNVARTTLSSKIFGRESEFFANLAVDAINMVKQVNPESGKTVYPVKSVGIMKQHGRSFKDSALYHGYVLYGGRAGQGMPRVVKNAKIAFLDIDLRKSKMAMGVQVVVTDPAQLEAIRQRESDITKERIMLLINAGANVVLTTKGIDDMAIKYFVDNGALAVRRVKKEDLRRVAKLTGGTMMITFADMEGNESFDASMLGTAEEVSEERIADDDHIVVKGGKTQSACSVLLRGANMHMLDEVERSLHDALCAIKRALESASVVPGGGCVESALSIYLENFATSLGSREQLAIAEFAQAMLVIPKQLSVNAAHDATDMVARLRASHNASQTDPSKAELRYTGMDCITGKVQNNLAAGIVEPALSKVKMIQFATEASITVLRIDDMIKLNPPEEEQGR
uniref:T-complex protein 1 subunit alpha n=1 Tax=Haptolina ericina TaxID=156174 RepID=A0A7S3FLI6_9EUKA